MVVRTLVITLRLAHVHSLKEKRSIIKSIMKRIQNRFNVSVSEVEYQDEIKKAMLAIAMVSNDKILVEKTLNRCIDLIDLDYNVEIVETFIN